MCCSATRGGTSTTAVHLGRDSPDETTAKRHQSNATKRHNSQFTIHVTIHANVQTALSMFEESYNSPRRGRFALVPHGARGQAKTPRPVYGKCPTLAPYLAWHPTWWDGTVLSMRTSDDSRPCLQERNVNSSARAGTLHTAMSMHHADPPNHRTTHRGSHTADGHRVPASPTYDRTHMRTTHVRLALTTNGRDD